MSPRILAITRAVAVIGGTGALIAGVTFAALTTNTVTLAANQLSVTTHVLEISNGGAFGDSVTGFNFSNLVIGDESTKQPFYFQNLANAPLALSVTAQGSTDTVTSVDPTKVHVKFYDKDGTTVLANTTLDTLLSGNVALSGQLDANAQGNGGAPGTEGNYFVSMEVDSLGVTGPNPSVTGVDLKFTGTSL